MPLSGAVAENVLPAEVGAFNVPPDLGVGATQPPLVVSPATRRAVWAKLVLLTGSLSRAASFVRLNRPSSKQDEPQPVDLEGQRSTRDVRSTPYGDVRAS